MTTDSSVHAVSGGRLTLQGKYESKRKEGRDKDENIDAILQGWKVRLPKPKDGKHRIKVREQKRKDPKLKVRFRARKFP